MKIKDKAFICAISDYTSNYLHKIKAISNNTIISYTKTLELFINYLIEVKKVKIQNLSRGEFTDQTIIDYIDYLKTTKGNTNSTINQRLSALKSFAKYLNRSNLLGYDEYSKILDIEKLSVTSNELVELSIEDVKLILSLPDTKNRYGLRDLAFLTLLYDTGCRDSEILNLKLSDINKNDNEGKVNIVGKGNKFRCVPVSNDALKIIRQYIKYYKIEEKDSFLFYTVRNGIKCRMSDDNSARIFNKYEAKAKELGYNLPHLHPHLFRHARALHLYHAGMPMQLVSEWLGHTNIETSLIYAYADFDMKKQALEKLNIDTIEKSVDNIIDEDKLLKKFFGFK